jgi:hypothetical protein
MRTARTLEAEKRQVLRWSMNTGEKEDESSTGRVWAAGFQQGYGPFSLMNLTYEPSISLFL